jgi:ABC-2 type transport system permease protein
MSAVVVQDAPDAWYMRIASVFPLTSPFVLPARAALGHVTPVELTVAVGVMIAAIYALVRLAAGVYSGALLRSGERASIGDLWRAARAS